MAALLRWIALLATLLCAGCAHLASPCCDAPQAAAGSPPATSWQKLVLPQAGGEGIRVRFAGVSTLVFEEDGEPVLMTDGFFSRPSFPRVLLRRIGPDPARIRQGLASLDVGKGRLQAVIPLHAHYDHAMDSPTVAQWTGAALVGDASIENIGRGSGLEGLRFDKVAAGETRHYGRWRVSFIAADHAPTLLRFPGAVEKPLQPKQRANAWREGQPWSLLIEHASGKRFLVHASAGYRDGEIARALARRRVDVVFLGIGGAGRRADPAQREQLWAQTVRAADPARVIPIHWDDFFQGLDAPLRPMSAASDNLSRTLRHYRQLAACEQRDLRFAPLFVPFDPYAELPPQQPRESTAAVSGAQCR